MVAGREGTKRVKLTDNFDLSRGDSILVDQIWRSGEAAGECKHYAPMWAIIKGQLNEKKIELRGLQRRLKEEMPG